MFINDDHPSFQDRPNDADSVWRYMDLARYLSLIQNSALHFANAAQMSDPWEGSFSPVNMAIRPQMYGEHFEMMFRNADARRPYMLERVHLNCWHLGEVESAAMWSIYQREGRGVAVRSTWGKLTNSIDTPRAVYGAKVHYVDYNSTFIPEGITFDAFLHKRESFEHEREVRLIMLTGLSVPHPTEKGAAVDVGPEPPIIPIPVNLEELIEAVYVAPDAPDWVGDVVEAVTRRYDLHFPVKKSGMATDPVA